MEKNKLNIPGEDFLPDSPIKAPIAFIDDEVYPFKKNYWNRMLETIREHEKLMSVGFAS